MERAPWSVSIETSGRRHRVGADYRLDLQRDPVSVRLLVRHLSGYLSGHWTVANQPSIGS